MDVHPKERKPRAIGQLPEERALMERIISHGLVDVHRSWIPTTRSCSPGGHPGGT
jgi:exonuclease III